MIRHLLIILFAVKVAVLCGQAGKSPVKEVRIGARSQSQVPKPTAPPDLVISDIFFSDAVGNNNNMLDGGETAQISFQITNTGRGVAYGLEALSRNIRDNKGLTVFVPSKITSLEAGKGATVAIMLTGNEHLETGEAEIEVLVKEANHFDGTPFTVKFATVNYKIPKLVIADHVFTTDQQGKIRLGQSVALDVIIQNQGQGVARKVEIDFMNPENVYPANETRFDIAALAPNETRTVRYEFFANKRYDRNFIPIKVNVKENTGKVYTTMTFSASLQEEFLKSQSISVQGQQQNPVYIEFASLKSDVDRDIPVNDRKYENKYALIIGNEDYASYQPNINSEMNVLFAINDALVFKEYCQRTLGVPEENTIVKINATAGQMLQAIDKLNKLIKATNGKAQVIVYYAGHGLPDEAGKAPYLIPVDVSGNNITAGIKLSYLYEKLAEFPAERIYVFMDACFSGGSRGESLIAARGVKVTPGNEYLKGNIWVLTASTGQQSSLPWKAKKHGMFTYFLLKQIQEYSGNIELGSLAGELKSRVSLESVRVNEKEQHPTVLYSEQIKDIWKEWRLK